MAIYQPSDDSFLFSDFLKDYFSKQNPETIKHISYLDMGTGSGILAETAKQSGIKNILAADINKEAVNYVKQKGFRAIQSNLFSKIPKFKGRLNVKGNLVPLRFDVVTFNAPYLPQSKHDKKPDTTGGKKGGEIALKFLKQAKKHLAKNGKIFLLISSLTPQDNIRNFKPEVVASKKLFFEELLILQVSAN